VVAAPLREGLPLMGLRCVCEGSATETAADLTTQTDVGRRLTVFRHRSIPFGPLQPTDQQGRLSGAHASGVGGQVQGGPFP